MRKIVGFALLLVLLIGGAALWYVLGSLESIVARAIADHGSRIAGTAVRVDSVQLSLQRGRGELHGLRIANPAGYAADDTIRFSQIALQIDPGSVAGSPLVIDEILIADPEVHYELAANGKSNMDTLLENIDRHQLGAKQGNAEESTLLARVGRLTFEHGKVSVDSSAIGGPTVEASLPTVKLRNLGGAGGAPASELGAQALEAYSRRVLSEVASGALRGGVDKLLQKGSREAGGLLRGMLDRIGKDEGDAAP